MSGEAGLPATNCGLRNWLWLGSFQIDHCVARVPYLRPTAVMNCANSSGSGRVSWSVRVSVAHCGTGPVTVSRTCQPRALAACSAGSYFDQS